MISIYDNWFNTCCKYLHCKWSFAISTICPLIDSYGIEDSFVVLSFRVSESIGEYDISSYTNGGCGVEVKLFVYSFSTMIINRISQYILSGTDEYVILSDEKGREYE